MATSQLFQTTLGIVKEASFGGGGTIATWLPITNPRFQPKALRNYLDNGYRGQPAVDFDVYAGPGEGTFSFGGNFYADSCAPLFMNLFGTDTPTGGADPYSHVLTTASAPASHFLQWKNGVQAYDFMGARINTLTLNFNARDGALNYTVQGMSKFGVAQGSPVAPVFTSVAALGGWEGALTVSNGWSSAASLLEGSLTFTRALQPLHALNSTQDVAAIYPQGLQITGRFTFDYTQTTEWLLFTTNPPASPTVSLAFTRTQTNARSITVLMTKCAVKMVDIEAGDGLYTAVMQFNGLYNSTDSGPGKVTIQNATATL